MTVPQGKIGLRLCPRRRAAAAEPDARPGGAVQQLPGRPSILDRLPAAGIGPAGESAFIPVGQRGRQRAILREGVYAINLAFFVVMTENMVYRAAGHRRRQDRTGQSILNWQKELRQVDGFGPVVVGGPVETMDPIRSRSEDDGGLASASSPSTTARRSPPGEIIAPPSATSPTTPNYHNNYQDPEAFLRSGGRRGRQYVPLTDGTYFINRWFATVELMPKTVVPIGYVGVVVSYYGRPGKDLSGDRLPPRRARRRGRARRLGEAARARQISVQHLRRQHHPRADDQLRAALDHRQDRIAPLRREPAVDRPGDARTRTSRCCR